MVVVGAWEIEIKTEKFGWLSIYCGRGVWVGPGIWPANGIQSGKY